MDIVFTKSFWELDLSDADDPIATFAEKVAGDGFDGVEMFLPLLQQPPHHVDAVLRDHGLDHRVIDIVTEGETPLDHLRSLDAAIEAAMEFDPHLINSHTGRDIFTFADNKALYLHAIARSDELGIPIVHETHRFRPTYSAVETRRYLTEIPELLLNADLSHWMVVHESDLTDQDDNVEVALARSRHIHARVGFEEGPQIGDPTDPAWATHVERHIELWQRIAHHCRAADVATLRITPEFGPPPYAPTLPFSGEPVTDVWQANVAMRDLLRSRFT